MPYNYLSRRMLFNCAIDKIHTRRLVIGIHRDQKMYVGRIVGILYVSGKRLGKLGRSSPCREFNEDPHCI
jgi:hypothetical protein